MSSLDIGLQLGYWGAQPPADFVGMAQEAEANEIRKLFFEGKRAEAIAVVPDEFADEISLLAPADRIRDRLQAWRETPITILLVPTQDKAVLTTIAELVLG